MAGWPGRRILRGRLGPGRGVLSGGRGEVGAGQLGGRRANAVVSVSAKEACADNCGRGRRAWLLMRAAGENSRSHRRLGSERRAGWSAGASICSQAVSSQVSCTIAHQIRFWSKPCRTGWPGRCRWLRGCGLRSGRGDDAVMGSLLPCRLPSRRSSAARAPAIATNASSTYPRPGLHSVSTPSGRRPPCRTPPTRPAADGYRPNSPRRSPARDCQITHDFPGIVTGQRFVPRHQPGRQCADQAVPTTTWTCPPEGCSDPRDN